jgi:hypothetical protein
MKFIQGPLPKVPDPNEHRPMGWKAFEAHVMTPAIVLLDLAGSVADINRFGNRFRVAHAFQGITLDGFGSTTAKGYSALFRLMLAWSAFELFMDLIKVKQKATGLNELLTKHGHGDLQKEVRTLDNDDLFFKFIVERVNQSHKNELANYFKDDPCNATFLASSIRHIFVHGDLTPGAGGTEEETAGAICASLADAHLHVMSEEFGKRIDDMLETLYDKR